MRRSLSSVGLAASMCTRGRCPAGSDCEATGALRGDEVIKGFHWSAVKALRCLAPLAGGLCGELDASYEAACELIQLGHAEHPTVQDQIGTSPAAAELWQFAIRRRSASM